MNNLIEHILNEITFNDLRVKQRSIGKLFPPFGARVKAVAANGGVSMREQMPTYWHFQVASGTKPGIKYDVYVQFLNIEQMIKKYAGDQRLWNTAGDNVDLRLLAAEILNKVDMKTSCSCPATLYWGQDYIRTQRDAQFGRQEDRPPNVRNPRQYGAYCKHGQLVFNVLPAYTSTFATFLKKFWIKEIDATVEIAKEQAGLFKQAAAELGQRAEDRPAAFSKSGREVPLPPGEVLPEEEPPEEEPPEEDVPPTPPDDVPGPKRPGPATKGAGEIAPKATRPAVKRLGIEPEVRPKDKGRKGKYKAKESVNEKEIFKPASKDDVKARRAAAIEARDMDLLFDEHDIEGIKLFGQKRWDNANIGWGSSDGAISSKVYGNPTMILDSWYEDDEIVHETHQYNPSF